MRSHGEVAEQEALPFETPARPRVDGVRPAPAGPVRPFVVTLGDELAQARGWPAGTEVVVDPTRHPARADVVVASERGVMTAGVVDRQFGRPVIRNDRGVIWIGLGAEVVGVVTEVAPALHPVPPEPS